MKRRTRTWLMSLLILFTGACGNDAASPDPQEVSLKVEIAAEPETFAPGETVTLTVTAENPTESRIDFGEGSSSCRYSAVVRFDNEDYDLSASRICTPDIMLWSLDPGERRSESWVWTGDVVIEGAWQTLPPDVYELRGVADGFSGSPFTVEITN